MLLAIASTIPPILASMEVAQDINQIDQEIKTVTAGKMKYLPKPKSKGDSLLLRLQTHEYLSGTLHIAFESQKSAEHSYLLRII